VLSESQNRLGVVIKTAPIILWSFNKVGIITLWEGHGTELIGTKPGELVGKSALEWYSARPDVHVLMNRALAGEEINQVITDKTGIAFETHFTPQYDELGQIVGVVAVSTDVTERDRAQAQIAFQALLLQHVNDAVLAVDHKNIIRAWNTSAERIYGWSAAEAVNQSISDLLQTVWVDGSRDLTYKALAETGLWQGEVIQKNKAGKNINIDLIVTVLKDETGKTIGYVRVGRDITERKRMEVELREVRRRLLGRTETERIELAQELHDGPMQELYGLVYQIKSLEENVADTDIKGTLESSRDKLQQVINDLRLTASDLRPPALAPFGLYKAIQSHAEQYNRSNPELKVSLDLQEDGLELSEEVRLALFRIYQVALTNVIRHAQATQVDIRFHINEHQILLEVEDNGVGFQASKRWIELAREGHLGLIGASERAESIGGRLKVESQPGKGSTVRVAVPRKKGTGPL
jgi:PAS domain S-box-containing protein